MTALAGKGLVLVEHGYEYLGRDGGLVSIKPNERYVLLSKTNNDWWHVRKDEKAKPIYIPARYVKELPSHFPSPLDFIQQLSDSAAPEQGGHKGAADLPEKRPDEVTIKLRSAPNRRRQENRLSTFGVPLDVHEPSFMRSGLVDPMIALLPRTAASPHSKDVSSHLKRYSLAPGSLFGSHPPAEELQPLAVKPRIPSFSPVDPTIRPTQAKPVVPPIIKDLPRVQVPTELSKPPAETEEPSRQDTENIYESILDIQEQQQKELAGSGIGPALSLAPAPSPALSPAPSPASSSPIPAPASSSNPASASSSSTPAPASSSNPTSASSSLTPAPAFPVPASSSNPAPASSFPAPASSSPASASSSNPAPASSSPAPASSSPAPASSSNPAPASSSPAPAPASSSASAVVITAAPGPLSPPGHIPSQVKNENPSTAVYANVAELKSGSPLPPPSASSSSGAFHFPPAPLGWETNDNEEGKSEQHRTPGTGKSAWDNPGCPPLDQEPALQVLPPGLAPHLPAASPQAPAAGRTEQKQLLDEAAGRLFPYNPVSGGMSWLPPVPTTPCPSPPMEPKSLQNVPDDGPPPLPEEDYPTEERGAHLAHPKDYNFARIKQTVIPRASLGSGGPAGWLSVGDPEGQGPLTGEQQPPVAPGQPDQGNGVIMDSVPVMKNWRHTIGPAQFNMSQGDANFFPTHTRSPSDYASDASSLGNSPESRHQTHNLEKAGILNKTKISENGKRLRKSWSQSWTVLHDGILTFHKDPKSSTSGISGKTTQILPEYTIELRGAVIGWASKEKSSKRNVLELKTRHGSEYLIQYDTDSIITDWHKVILDSIRQQDLDYHPKEEVVVEEEVSEKSPGLQDRDDKDKRRISNRTSMSGPGTDSEQGRVRQKLRKFLQRRPTLQSVKEKGYIQENVFGCHLDTLCRRENSTTPSFMEKCIKSVEERGLDVDGIYRVSGNLAVIQKLRHKADHEEDLDLDDGQWEEIHVITGALKLFLRELPEPLFPFSHFDGFIAAIKLTDYSQRVSYMCDLVKTLPLPNHNTMKLLFTHLRKVIEYKDVNRMSVQSVAIVFGPTLLRPETESANITVHMVFQNQIVELILNEYEKIFCQD